MIRRRASPAVDVGRREGGGPGVEAHQDALEFDTKGYLKKKNKISFPATETPMRLFCVSAVAPPTDTAEAAAKQQQQQQQQKQQKQQQQQQQQQQQGKQGNRTYTVQQMKRPLHTHRSQIAKKSIHLHPVRLPRRNFDQPRLLRQFRFKAVQPELCSLSQV